MTKRVNLKTFVGTLTAITLLTVPQAAAHDPEKSDSPEKNLRMISSITLMPSKEKEWTQAWKDIQDMADDADYPFTEVVIKHRNKRWIITPLSNYGDIDDVMAARKKVSEKGGSRAERTFAKFDSAMTDSNTFLTRLDPKLSYMPEGYEPGPYAEIETYYYKSGKDKEMKSVVSDFKDLYKELDMPNGYQVYWNGIGTNGNSITVVSYADNALDMAKVNAASDEMLGEKKDRVGELMARFLDISLNSTTEHGMIDSKLSINLE